MKIQIKINIILTVLLALSFQSCNKSKEQAQNIIEKWVQKEVKIPKSLLIKAINSSETNVNILNHQYKVLVYIDSLSCIPCRLHLREWKQYLNTSQIKKSDVGFLFVIQTKSYKKIEDELYIDNFTYPVIYDFKDEFNRLNQFPKEERFRTFLLDDKNRILLIGSPIENLKLRELYNETIGGRKKTRDKINSFESSCNQSMSTTNVQVSRDSISMGRFSIKSTKYVSFQIKNVNKQPLVILSVNTTCGCTVAKYENKPIVQGESTTVLLEYKPSSLGYFKKTADVVCNVPKGFVRLTISGEVVN